MKRREKQPQSSEPDVEQVPSKFSVDSTHSATGEHTMSKKFDFDSLVSPDKLDRKKELKQRIRQLQEVWEQLEVEKGEVEQKKAAHKQTVETIKEKMIFS